MREIPLRESAYQQCTECGSQPGHLVELAACDGFMTAEVCYKCLSSAVVMLLPARTDRERWVDQAARIPKPCGYALAPIMEQVYDAMLSGTLDIPGRD